MRDLVEGLEPPYYAVIFTALAGRDLTGYAERIAEMLERVKTMPGFLGVEAAAEADGEIVVSYWKDAAAIARWREDEAHRAAQRQGRAQWYAGYAVRVARVERSALFMQEAEDS